MELHEIINKLVGPIDPTGAHSIDEFRIGNLNTMIDLIEDLLCDLRRVAQNHNQNEASVKKAGTVAKDYLNTLHVD
jgi:hypothetical protein